MEYVQMTLNEWVEIKQKLRQELIGVKRSFVRIGYILRQIDDQKGYVQDGYKSIAEFAQKELGLHPSTTTRFMEINREYSIDGYSEQLREEYEDLSRSQLEEMLKLPEEDRAMIEPAASRESIRDLKRFNAAQPEQSVTDCHQVDGEGQQADKLADLIESFFHDNPKELNTLFSLPEPSGLTEEYIREAAEIINPGGNRSYRKGIFFVMMYENKIMVKQFGRTPRELSWAEFLQRTWDIFGEVAAGAKTWDNYFAAEAAETDAEEGIPETTEEPETTECGAEGEVEHGKKEENETGNGVECGGTEAHDAGTEGDAHTEEHGNTPDQGKNTAQQEASEKTEIAPAQKSAPEPVTTEGGADFEKPENAKKPDMNPPEVIDAGKSRREYLDSLTDEGIAEEIVKKIKEMREARRLDEILKQRSWTAWLKESVDYLGRTIEEEEEQ